MQSDRRRLGIDYFIHPLPLASVLLLAVNDHLLKARYHSWLTGKLSDFAGLFFFPIFLCAVFNLLRSCLDGKIQRLTHLQIVVAIAVTDLIFVSVKFVPSITFIYLEFSKTIGIPSHVTPDKTDLLALAMNLGTWCYAYHSLSQCSAHEIKNPCA